MPVLQKELSSRNIVGPYAHHRPPGRIDVQLRTVRTEGASGRAFHIRLMDVRMVDELVHARHPCIVPHKPQFLRRRLPAAFARIRSERFGRDNVLAVRPRDGNGPRHRIAERLPDPELARGNVRQLSAPQGIERTAVRLGDGFDAGGMAKLREKVVVVFGIEIGDRPVYLGGRIHAVAEVDAVTQKRRKRRPDFAPGAAEKLVGKRFGPGLLPHFVRVNRHIFDYIARARQGENSRRHIPPVLRKPLPVKLVAFEPGDGGRSRRRCGCRVAGADQAPRFAVPAQEPILKQRRRHCSIRNGVAEVDNIRALQGCARALVRPVAESDAPDRQIASGDPCRVVDMPEHELPPFGRHVAANGNHARQILRTVQLELLAAAPDPLSALVRIHVHAHAEIDRRKIDGRDRRRKRLGVFEHALDPILLFEGQHERSFARNETRRQLDRERIETHIAVKSELLRRRRKSKGFPSGEIAEPYVERRRDKALHRIFRFDPRPAGARPSRAVVKPQLNSVSLRLGNRKREKIKPRRRHRLHHRLHRPCLGRKDKCRGYPGFGHGLKVAGNPLSRNAVVYPVPPSLQGAAPWRIPESVVYSLCTHRMRNRKDRQRQGKRPSNGCFHCFSKMHFQTPSKVLPHRGIWRKAERG